MIYLISAHSEDGRKSRAFGYYPDLTSAYEAVEEDLGAMHESLYTHLCIEQVLPGIHGEARVVAWYRWSGGLWHDVVVGPPWAKDIVNLGGVG